MKDLAGFTMDQVSCELPCVISELACISQCNVVASSHNYSNPDNTSMQSCLKRVESEL